MAFGLVIIGDEILSGRRQDKHLPYLIELLKSKGQTLSWVKILADDEPKLVEEFQRSLSEKDIVFSTGGIGGTPDDLTRGAVAKALQEPLQRHPDAIPILEQRARERQQTVTPEQFRMIEFPERARLIPNPINRIPGFSVANHHFMPGFPQMAAPMMEWVLDTYYQHLTLTDYCEKNLWVENVAESTLSPMMEALLVQFPRVKLFSLPMIRERGSLLELGLKGREPDVIPAWTWLQQQLKGMALSILHSKPSDV